MNRVVYWGDWAGLMHATNASTGQDIWATQLGSRLGSCGSQTLGVIGTATYATETITGVETPVIYIGVGQSNLYALNAQTGAILWQTNFGISSAEIIYGSPAVYNGSVYIGVSSTGDCPLIQGQMFQVNASTGTIQHTFDAVPSGCIGVGIWDTPTIDESTGMLYFGTGNANPYNCKTTEPLGSGSPINKAVLVAHASRFTESVNADLNTPTNSGTYQTDAALVAVTNPSTCVGIVAERPMYFTNFAGVSSGSDLLGSTHTGTTFYFADVPTGGGYASFLTILNPGTTTATVTATFVAAGATVNSQTQTIQVAGGTRGTIIPNNSGALLHAAVTVTASQPVVVERPTYFHNVTAGNAQTVSGAASVVGVQALQKEWLFAEGYTGIVLQNLLVPHDTFAGYEVSLVAQSSSGAFVAERPMYWNTGSSGTQGGSDIFGYVGN